MPALIKEFHEAFQFELALEPLTQASIPRQPTQPVSLSKPSPTCGILPKKNATQTVPSTTRGIAHPTFLRMPHIWNSVRPRPTFLRMPYIRDLSGAIPPSPDVSHLESVRRHSYLSLDVSHPESVRRHSTLSGCLSSGICPPSSHLLRMSLIRNPSAVIPTFLRMSLIRNLSADIPPYPDVSHPGSVRRHPTFSGCLSSGICPPTSRFLRMSHIRNSVRPKSTFSGCLTSDA
ncbi:hypothetical protein VitviT2T_029937 [Vitis vinifera]|uniref:Uncharacterized protein n=1 Tax=Vitis vinifera TaxID=29760 RepID=A0ABY9DYK3_VITVI|nr:hypothetical protein VitviT2T_029937 [Vitis vinifera]